VEPRVFHRLRLRRCVQIEYIDGQRSLVRKAYLDR
jgi:hypothetical protein